VPQAQVDLDGGQQGGHAQPGQHIEKEDGGQKEDRVELIPGGAGLMGGGWHWIFPLGSDPKKY
jgi:hypothetical protein